MKLSRFAWLVVFGMSIPLFAQTSAPASTPPPPGNAVMRMRTDMVPGMAGGVAGGMTVRREMGEWWKNSEIAKKLQLTSAQISKLNQIFYDHRLHLIDYSAAMQKEDLRLQNLLDQDTPDEKQVSTEVDNVLTARGKLEREFTMMNLDLRLVLSVDQWRQLKALQEERAPVDRVFFYRKMGPNTFYKRIGPDPGPDFIPDGAPLPLPPPDPAPDGEF